MRILVTGANGFIGRHLVADLACKNHQVIACVRSLESARSLIHQNVTISEISGLSAETNWSDYLHGVDVVVHAAAQVSDGSDRSVPQDYRSANVDGTVKLAVQSLAAGVRRFVFLSSIKVNGSVSVCAVRPEDPACPDDDYSASKHEAEQLLFALLDQSSMPLTVIRPPLVYGPGVKANFESMLRAVKRGVPLPLGSLDQNRRSMVSIGNLVDFIGCALDHPGAENEVFLVSDGQDLSTKTLLEMIAGAMGKRPLLLPVPVKLLAAAANLLGKGAFAERLTGSLCADISKTKALLGWSPPLSVEEGIQLAVDDFLLRQ